MGLKHLGLKLKGIKIGRFFTGDGKKKVRNSEDGRRDSWMNHVSHGYHVVELDSTFNSVTEITESDSVVVQREQVRQNEFWFFGVFDNVIGGGVTKYMQSHFFDKIPNESKIGKQCKQDMKRAHLNAKAKLGDGEKSKANSAAAMVINNEKLVVANMGDYRTVICRDGKAYQICRKKQQQTTTRHWSLRLIPGLPKVEKTGKAKISKSSGLVVGTERIDSETEFVILASSGVWEVMRHEEAVNLIRHIVNPQEAAECLATEALNRMSRSKISCLIIRFD